MNFNVKEIVLIIAMFILGLYLWILRNSLTSRIDDKMFEKDNKVMKIFKPPFQVLKLLLSSPYREDKKLKRLTLQIIIVSIIEMVLIITALSLGLIWK